VTYTPELDAAVCATAARAYRPHGPLSFDEVRQIGRLAALEIVGRADARSFVLVRVEWRIRDAYRKARREVAMEPETLTAARDARAQAPDVADAVLGDARVVDLLSRLSVRERMLVQRVDLDGERVTDVARELGVCKGTVAASRHRALAKLRQAA
jgi:RNA polymerase sigma factor (sigma-70 family)